MILGKTVFIEIFLLLASAGIFTSRDDTKFLVFSYSMTSCIHRNLCFLHLFVSRTARVDTKLALVMIQYIYKNTYVLSYSTISIECTGQGRESVCTENFFGPNDTGCTRCHFRARSRFSGPTSFDGPCNRCIT